jgi:hypothetical protein
MFKKRIADTVTTFCFGVNSVKTSKAIRIGFFLLAIVLNQSCFINAQQILADGKPGELSIRIAGNACLRITLKPKSFTKDFLFTPALAEKKYAPPFIRLSNIEKPIRKQAGNFVVTVNKNPLTVTVSDRHGKQIQNFTFNGDGTLSFKLNDELILGLGEGGSKPAAGVNWRNLSVEYDRRGRYDSMQPRWQSDAYGSRNPVPLLIGTGGWALFVAAPWVQVDLQKKDYGILVPWKPSEKDLVLQTEKNQWVSTAKGLPPIDETIPGLYDFFVFDATDPLDLMQDFSMLTGPASMPPKCGLRMTGKSLV